VRNKNNFNVSNTVHSKLLIIKVKLSHNKSQRLREGVKCWASILRGPTHIDASGNTGTMTEY
jgi:hypothetical protein